MKEETKDMQQSGTYDEIDLIALVRSIWKGRRTIIKSIIIFTFLGLFVALFSQKEYTASTTIVPHLSSGSSKMGGLSSLASLAGFNLDMGSGDSELSPRLYPQILNSTSFLLEIINSEYSYDELQEEVTMYDYYLNYYKPGLFPIIKKYTIGLPGLILTSLKKEQQTESADQFFESGIIKISNDQYEVLKSVREKLVLNVNDKDGYLTIESRFHQAGLSSQIARNARILLQERVTQFRIEKARAQREFVNERYEEKKRDFEKAQDNLAAFRDSNKNISSAVKRTEEERMQNEYQLAFEIYSELAKQLEQAMIKEKEDTPVFAVIKEVVLPIKKSKPNRIMIITIWVFFGGVFGIMVVLFGKVKKSIIGRWNQ